MNKKLIEAAQKALDDVEKTVEGSPQRAVAYYEIMRYAKMGCYEVKKC